MEVVPSRGFKPSYGLKLWSMIGSKQDAKTVRKLRKSKPKPKALFTSEKFESTSFSDISNCSCLPCCCNCHEIIIAYKRIIY